MAIINKKNLFKIFRSNFLLAMLILLCVNMTICYAQNIQTQNQVSSVSWENNSLILKTNQKINNLKDLIKKLIKIIK